MVGEESGAAAVVRKLNTLADGYLTSLAQVRRMVAWVPWIAGGIVLLWVLAVLPGQRRR